MHFELSQIVSLEYFKELSSSEQVLEATSKLKRINHKMLNTYSISTLINGNGNF